MNWRMFAATAVGWVSLEGAATAHPRHGAGCGSESLFHYLTESLHARVPLVLAVGLAGFVFAASRSSCRKK